MSGKNTFIAGLPEYFFDFIQKYLKYKTVVFFEYKKSSDNLDYRLDLPHRDYKNYLSQSEKKKVTDAIKTAEADSITAVGCKMNIEGIKTDFTCVFYKKSDTTDTVSGMICDADSAMDYSEAVQKQLALGGLAMGLAHDLNNQLMVMYGMLSQIAEKNISCKELDILKQVADNSTHMLKQIINFSSADKGFEALDAHSMIAESAEMLTYNMSRNIIITQNFKANNHIILGRKAMLQSAILNLGINACDAMPEGGKLFLFTENETDNNGKQLLVIKIADSGSGIKKDDLPFIFNSFYTTKNPGEGAGLGLALAKDTVGQHGGLLSAESEKGKGSVLTIKLPVL